MIEKLTAFINVWLTMKEANKKEKNLSKTRLIKQTRTDTIISKSNQVTSNLLKSISVTEQTSDNLDKFQTNQSQANEVADYSWFINLASDVYIASQSSTFLHDRDIEDSVNTVSAKFASMVLDIDEKMKAGLESPFLDRHKELKESWQVNSEKISQLANSMFTLGDLAKVTQNGWFDAVGRWGNSYEVLYLVIPQFRLEEKKSKLK